MLVHSDEDEFVSGWWHGAPIIFLLALSWFGPVRLRTSYYATSQLVSQLADWLVSPLCYVTIEEALIGVMQRVMNFFLSTIWVWRVQFLVSEFKFPIVDVVDPARSFVNLIVSFGGSVCSNSDSAGGYLLQYRVYWQRQFGVTWSGNHGTSEVIPCGCSWLNSAMRTYINSFAAYSLALRKLAVSGLRVSTFETSRLV